MSAEKAVEVVSDEETLASISSIDDAMRVLADAGIGVTEVADLGDGFVLGDKAELVKVPLLLFDWKFADGDYGEKFAIFRVITQDGRKLVITDGGTGMRKQAQQWQERGVRGGVLCPRGLTRSEYEYVDDKGKHTPAETYYFTQ